MEPGFSDLSGSYVHIGHEHPPQIENNAQLCDTAQSVTDERVHAVKELRLVRVSTETIDSALAGRAKKEKDVSARDVAVAAATGASLLLVLYAIKRIVTEFTGYIGPLN